MKKLIMPLLLIILLCSCGINNTPVVPTVVNNNAVYQTGDFCFNCKIKYSNGVASVNVLSTNAKSLQLVCNGNNVTFSSNKLTKSIAIDTLPPTNPSIIIYQIMQCISSKSYNVSSSKGTYKITGTVSAGKFSAVIGSGTLQSVTVPEHKITIKFK